MNRFPTWTKWLACWSAVILLTSLAQAQSLSGLVAEPAAPKIEELSAIPQAPESGVQDTDGFFNRDQAAITRISEKFNQLEADHGFRIYLSVQLAIIGSTLGEISSQLQQAWIPDNNGMVIVFEANSKSLGISMNPSGPGNFEKSSELLPTHASSAAIRNAIAATDPDLKPAAYIESFLSALVKECNLYFEKRDQPQPPGRTLKIWMIGIGVLLLLGLLAIAIGWLVRHAERKWERKTLRFPQLDTPERFGAPCGARVTARQFGNPQPKRS